MNIGILIRDSGRFYSDPLLNGAYDYCSSKGIGMTVFAVEIALPLKERSSWRDFFLSRMGKAPIDAFICVSSTLSLDSRNKMAEALFEAIGDMPKVSIGVPMRSAALVSSDPVGGISDIMDHMVVEHGCRRFGFIAGPSHNYESRRRYELFQENLREHRIEFRDDCRFEGDYEHDSGGRGVEAFLEEGLLRSLDAIVCANDHMALGAWQRLQELGYEVPGRIALAGFDDVDLGLDTENPLTTVNQGVGSLGREAARVCHEAVLEGRPAEDVLMPTRLVLRGSCGCFPEASGADRLDPETRSFIEDAVGRAGSNLGGSDPDLAAFRGVWSSFVHAALRRSMTIGEIYGIAKRLYGNRETPESIVSTAMRTAFEIIGRERFISVSAANALSDRLDQFGHRLFGLDGPEAYGGILVDEFDALGFSLCMIGILESRDESLDRIRPIACWKHGALDEAPRLDSDGTFPAPDLLPDGMRGEAEESLMVLPLGRGEDARGLAVLDFDPDMLPLYSGIASRLTMSMRIWSNIESLENEVKLRRLTEAELSEAVLRDELTGLYNRRGFFVRAQESLDSIRASEGSYAVVYSDLDGLKGINDRWGHAAGDEALQDAAAALRKSVRNEDIVARLGGDEFALFVFLGDEPRGDSLESRLRSSVAGTDEAAKKRGREWTLSMSFGVLASDDRNGSLERLMAEADGMQYREKERKRAERRRIQDENSAG